MKERLKLVKVILKQILKKNKNMVSIFVLGDKSKKVQRIMELYGLSESVAEKLMFEKDMKRKNITMVSAKENGEIPDIMISVLTAANWGWKKRWHC